MTDPSQYFKGRTVQEQMTEVIGYVDTRAAEVATTAIASDVAQVHQDMLDADADAAAAAASASAAAGTLANAVKKTGEASQSIAGDISVSGDVSVGGDLGVTGTATVQAPVNNTDAANKKYVDDADALKINITDINNYAVGLTGSQNKSGQLQMYESNLVIFGSDTHDLKLKSRWMSSSVSSYNASMPQIEFITSDDVVVGRIYLRHNSGRFEIGADILNHDNTIKSVVLIRGDN